MNLPNSPYQDAVEGGNLHSWQPLNPNNHLVGFYGKHELASEGRHELPVETIHELRELPTDHMAHELNNEPVGNDR